MLDLSIEDLAPKRKERYLWLRLIVIGINSFAILGTAYLWSNRSVAIASYFMAKDNSINIDKIVQMQSIQIFIANFGIAVGNSAKRIARTGRVLYIFLAVIIGFCSFATTWVPNFWYILTLRCVMGFFMGIAWYQPLGLAWSTFPEKKGTIFGIFSCATFFALIAFNIGTLYLVNPNDSVATLKFDSDKNNEYFGEDVQKRVPLFFNVMGGIYVAMMLMCSICSFEQKRMGNISNVNELLNEPQFLPTDDETPTKRLTSFMVFKNSLRKKNVWLLCIMFLCMIIGPAIVQNNLVPYGTSKFQYSPSELSLVVNIITAFVPLVKLLVPAYAEKIGNQKLAFVSVTLCIINGCFFIFLENMNIAVYAILGGVSILSYHHYNTLTVTYGGAEFPKEVQPMIISHLGNFISIGDVGGQMLKVAGLDIHIIFIIGVVTNCVAILLLFYLRDGTIMGIKLPPKLKYSSDNESILT